MVATKKGEGFKWSDSEVEPVAMLLHMGSIMFVDPSGFDMYKHVTTTQM